MNLHIPKEPQHVKEWISSIEKISGKTSGVKWENLNVWYGNQLPKYLWGEWKDVLKPYGFTWQKFLKLLRHKTYEVILWYKGAQSWEDFGKSVIELIKGPLGQDLAKR